MAGLHSIEGLSESYARWRSGPLGQITDKLEQQLLSELAGSVAGRTVLDVGCGDGALASDFAQRGAIVTGLDADPAMIAAARRRTEIEATQLHLVEGQAERLPCNDAAFDLVLAVTVLCFVRDAGRAVAEMARVLKPGGRLVIGELGRWSFWAGYRRIRGSFGHPTWQGSARRSNFPGLYLPLGFKWLRYAAPRSIRLVRPQRGSLRLLIYGFVGKRLSDQPLLPYQQ